MSMANNSDPKELEKFAKVAKDWWDPKGPLKTLHDINPWRLNWIKERCALTDRRVLDVGCGGGLLSEAMAKSGAHVIGLDLENESLSIAKAHAQEHGLDIEYRLDAVEDFVESHAQQFDYVTCLEMLEHVPDPSVIVNACAKAVKPDGAVFFSTINRSLQAYATAILGAEYCLQLLPRGTHDYDKFIKPSELANWIRASGLTVFEMQGMDYNPITHQANTSKHLSVNYMVYCKS